MRAHPHIALIVILLLGACVPKKPEIPLTEVSVGPLLQILEQRRRSFSGLRAAASVQAVRQGRKRSFESVGIILKGQEKFRIEAYGPLGQSIAALLWKGKNMLFLAAGEHSVIQPNHGGLERILGADLEPAELIAILSGNAPAFSAESEKKAFCGQDGGCSVEVSQGDVLRRVRLLAQGSLTGTDVRIKSYELFRAGRLVYQARFDQFEPILDYLMPRTIIVESLERKSYLSVEYGDVEVNVPIDDGEFSISGVDDADL